MAQLPGKLSGQFRSYYFDRNFTTPRLFEALAVGGDIKYETPSWNNMNLCFAGFTSQGLFIKDPNHGGTNILGPSQEGYSVLGLANLKYSLNNLNLVLYRQAIDTPFINTNDVRMTPYLFEAYTAAYLPNEKVSLFGSYVNKIKGWVDTEFRPMSDFAGYPGTNKAVTILGMTASPTDTFIFQGWNYFCNDFMNVIYVQADAGYYVNKAIKLSGSIQSFDQRSIGQSMAGSFVTGMMGVQGALSLNNNVQVSLSLSSTNKNHDIVNPWGAYPGFTAIIEEDSDLAGEQAWAIRLINDFGRVGPVGLKTNLAHCQAYISGTGSYNLPGQQETDLTIDCQFTRDFTFRLRGATVQRSINMGEVNFTNIRAIANYNF